MSNIYEAARKYLSQGWSVIPIAAGSKRPVVRWVQDGYADTRADFLTLQAWFAGQDRNLAIVTGPVSGLIALDIDDPKLYDEYINKYPTGLVSTTPNGGYHLLYKYDGDDIGNSVSRLASGLDVRGRHGYIVVEPSEIVRDDLSVGEYKWLKQGEPTHLPAELRDLLLAELSYSGTTDVAVNREDGHALWVRVLTSGFTAHAHNQEVKDVARYLFRQGMNEDAIINTLTPINAKDATPQPQGDLVAIRAYPLRQQAKTSRRKARVRCPASRSSGFAVRQLLREVAD